MDDGGDTSLISSFCSLSVDDVDDGDEDYVLD